MQIVAVGALMECYLQTPPKQSAMVSPVMLHCMHPPLSLQIVAVGALMEAVRCEQGVGVFAGKLYCQLLAALVTSTAVQPEVRGRRGKEGGVRG